MSNNTKDQCLIFVIAFCSYGLFSAFFSIDGFELFGDSIRYDFLSDRLLNGQHDLDITAFVSAPLYPYFCALVKYFCPANWDQILLYAQFAFTALSSVMLYKISTLLFAERHIAILSACLLLLYPFTAWYGMTISQEALFILLLLGSIYYGIKYSVEAELSCLLKMGFLLCLTILCKSHAASLWILITGILLYLKRNKHLTLFLVSTLIFLSPLLIRNIILYDKVSYSNFAVGSMLLAGHSEQTYSCLALTAQSPQNNIQSDCELNFIFHPPYEFGSYGQINKLPPPDRDKQKIKLALDWIHDNPLKTLELKATGLLRLMIPSVDFRVYPIPIFITSLILGLLLYIPSIITIVSRWKKGQKDVLIPFLLFACVALIFVIFYPQNRFRIITLEPLLMVYAAPLYYKLLKKKLWLNHSDPDSAHPE